MNTVEKTKSLQAQMLKNLARLVKYNSVQGEKKQGMPFGEQPAACLEEALSIARELGFETCNMENYCGWAQIGEGEEIIAIAAHLDIVPAGEGWKTDPFTLVEKDGKLYGRGVSDDKGAVIASLYAMKLLRDTGIPLNKRIRLIMGCNEETGSECMKYYSEHGEKITAGFTPDGNFPGIYGEKGMCALTAYSKNTKIISMNGGFVSNAVCNRCETKVPDGAVDVGLLKKALESSPLTGFEITEENGAVTVTAVGTAAHASTPDLGVNAAGCTMSALKCAGMKDDFVDFYLSRIGTSCDGEGIGCKFADEYGALTLNNGIVRTENGVISCTVDIRFPVTATAENMRERLLPYLEDEKGRIEINGIHSPLFYPPQSDLVRKLYEAYTEVTGDTVNKPMVIGGGTYAKSLNGIIAFGCEFPNVDNHIHDANECLSIEELHTQIAIYVKALEKLLN